MDRMYVNLNREKLKTTVAPVSYPLSPHQLAGGDCEFYD